MKETASGELKRELEEFVHTFGLGHFPSQMEVYKLTNSHSLCAKIERTGGYIYWASKLGLPNKKPQSKWSYDKALKLVKEIVEHYNLNHFPTLRQMNEYCGDASLSAYLTKTVGLKQMAEQLGLPIKDSETKTGWIGEDILEGKLQELGYNIRKQSTICPYDFVVGYTRIDCKYSKIYHSPNGGFYSFNLESKNHDCDIFILICEDDEGNRKFYVVPNVFVFNQSQISIGLNRTKWEKFENRFDYIDKFENFYKEMM